MRVRRVARSDASGSCAGGETNSRRARGGAAACVAILFVTGCTRFAPLSLDPATSAALLESRTLQSQELRAYVAANLGRPVAAWPLPSWDLETLTLAAFFYSPDLDVARAQWGAARAAETTAAARPNPSISLSPERAEHGFGAPSMWIAGVSFDIPIETAGKRGYRIDKASALSQTAMLAIGTAAWKVRSRLRDALFERESAIRRQGLLHERVAVQRAAAGLYDRRVRAGAASRGDADPIRLALERARIEEGRGRTSVAEATAAVAAAIGIPASALDGVKIEVSLEAPLVTDLSPAHVRRRALQQRADVLGALAAFAASQSALQLEVARQYPDVHLGPGYQYDQGNGKWSVGLTVDLPVFDRNQGPIAEAEAARRQAVAQFVSTQATALADVDAAFASAASAHANLESAVAASSAARAQADRVDRAVAVGTTDRVDAGVARIDALDAALAEVDARLALARAFGKLEDAVQAPLGVNLKTEPLRTAATSAAASAETKQ